MKLAIRIDAQDNVAMAMDVLQQGETLSVLSDRAQEVDRVVVTEAVPLAYHKVALTTIAQGDPIYKYGQVIGYATAPIARGQWVHLHNVESVNYGKSDERRTTENEHRQVEDDQPPSTVHRPSSASFWGYPRPDGQIGVRNHLLVMATCDCAYEEAKKMAAQIPGVVAVGQFHGCGADPMIVRTMIGVANNPNVGAVLLVGLGCETITVDLLAAGLEGEPGICASGKPLADVVIQRDGGSLKAIEKGTRILREMAAQISGQQRRRGDVSRLFLALQCGGSDGTSGIAANPAVGVAADMLVDAGGTAVFSETGEMTGTGHLLARRAATPEVAARIHAIIENNVSRNKLAGGGDERRLPQGNHDGGLTTIEEKSLGSIRKGGTRPIQGVLEHSLERTERTAGPGLYIQDGTGWDVASITHMAALGAQVAIFTTGRGSTTGHAILPVIKVTGTPATYERMSDNMDVNAGRIVLGEAGIAEVGAEIYELLLKVASGRVTKPEALGFEDFQIYRQNRAVERILGACP